MVECPNSPTGIHAIPRGPPITKEEFEEWNKLSLEKKLKSQRCIYCGVAIW